MGPIAQDDNGNRKMWDGQSWIDLPNSRAAGGAYLPQSFGKPDKSEAAYYNAWRKEQDPAYTNAQDSLRDSREMEGLLTKQKTGGIYAVPVVGDVAGVFDPEIRRMDSLSSAAARHKRQPGEGTISDFDAKMFQQQVYSKAQPTETNKMIILADRQAASNGIARREFNDWFYQTYGSRVGADEAWGKYVQANPIFDPNAASQRRTQLNPNRQQWRQYFGAVRGDMDARPGVAEADIQRSQGKRPQGWSQSLPKPQLKAAMLFKGSKAPAGSAQNPYVPQNADEFRKLPSGSRYIDDDGSIQVKR